MKLPRKGLLWIEEYDGSYTYLWEPLQKDQWRVGYTSCDDGRSWECVKDVFRDSEGINPRVIYPNARHTDLSEDEVIFRLL